MKVTKRQLRRIIKEERAKLARESRDQADQALKAYQDGFHGGAHVGVEEKFETALYEMQEMFVQLNGVSHQEAGEMVMDEVERILGTVR